MATLAFLAVDVAGVSAEPVSASSPQRGYSRASWVSGELFSGLLGPASKRVVVRPA